jgi:hypothetical protein
VTRDHWVEVDLGADAPREGTTPFTGNLVQGNNLWVPTGQTAQGYPRYMNQAGSLQVERGGWSWGAQFGDLNNDGWLDLYLTNGYISADRGKS